MNHIGHKEYVYFTMPMLRRARDLRDAGLGTRAIAAVLELDFGCAPSPTTIRNHIGSAGPGALQLSHTPARAGMNPTPSGGGR